MNGVKAKLAIGKRIGRRINVVQIVQGRRDPPTDREKIENRRREQVETTGVFQEIFSSENVQIEEIAEKASNQE
jgi:hypothetical protein